MTCVWCNEENPVNALQCGSCSSVFVDEAAAERTLVRSIYKELSVAGQALVSGPGIHKTVSSGLFIAGSLYALATVLAIAVNVLGLGLDDAIDGGASVWRLQLAYGNLGLVICMVYLAVSGAIFAGAICLRGERHLRFGILAALAAVLPLFPPYCLLITPIGLWALVALLRNRFEFV